MNIPELLSQAAERRPEHPAVIFEGRSSTYAELDRLCNRFAHALNQLGVAAGGVVAIFLESCPELLIAYLGSLKAGAIPNVVNGFLKPEEVRAVVADSLAVVLITDPGRFEELSPVRDQLGTRAIVLTGEASMAGGTHTFATLLEQGSNRSVSPKVNIDDLASLLYTSGTTGRSKGVMLSHRNIVENAETFGRVHYTPEDRLLVAAPLFHCWGLINGILGIFVVGGTAVILRRFQTEPVLDLIESTRPTIMIGVPVMFNFMTKSPSLPRRDLTSLRFVLSAAAPTPLELIEALRRDWRVGYAESYGLTETSPVITTTRHEENRPGSCGRAMGNTELKVAGPDGEDLPQGATGELWARGTAISAGYFRQPEATAEVFTPDGWFRTGDIVHIDADGYVFIVDRVKDMINVAGEKVYPRDVEEVLHRHPAVADAVVMGVPDPERGEVVKAYIVRKPEALLSAEELVSFLKPQLASFKLPRIVEFVETIPRSASGKALRRQLR